MSRSAERAASAPQFALGSRVEVQSAGTDAAPIRSSGTYRGLVAIGGENALVLELDGTPGSEPKGRLRFLPLAAVLLVDIVEMGKGDEEKRSEPTVAPGYFR